MYDRGLDADVTGMQLKLQPGGSQPKGNRMSTEQVEMRPTNSIGRRLSLECLIELNDAHAGTAIGR
jgi:hypothetical protein